MSGLRPGEGLTEEDLTEDGLLGGRVRLWQPRRGYRAAIDPVLLAAAVPARPGERVLDLGCGAGAAALCLGARVPGVTLAGLEIDPRYLALALRNAALNGIPIALHEGDVAAPPAALRAAPFDQVMMNPPFHDPAGTASPEPDRDRARREGPGIAVWIEAGLRRLRSGGRLTAILRTERLPAVLGALADRAGGIVAKPLAGRAGRAAKRVIVTAQKGSRTPFRLAPPLVLHDAAAHLDGGDYSPLARAVLAEGAALDLTEDR